MRRLAATTLVAIAMSAVAYTVATAVPATINYQAVLTADGIPVTTTVEMTFRIYDSDDGGTVLWTEPRSVDPDADGLIHVVLGTVNPIPDSAFAGPESWLSVQVESDPELLPMIRLTSSPYSFRVGSVDGALGGTVTGAVSINYSPAPDKAAAMVDEDAILIDPDDARGPILGVRDPGGGYTLLSGGSSEYYEDVLSHKDVTAVNIKSEIGLAGLIIFGATDADTLVHIDATGKARIGWGNTNYGSGAFCLGSQNSAAGDSSTISGGNSNLAGAFYATVGGGLENQAWGWGTVSGGSENVAGGVHATVGGGYRNEAHQSNSTIGGGMSNDITGPQSSGTIGGGTGNEVTGNGGAIGGGFYNKSNDSSSVVCGGTGNRARGKYSVVGGGGCNFPTDRDTNSALGHWSVIDGGQGNIAFGDYSSIGGGVGNTTGDTLAVVAGGRLNSADRYATVGGGRTNVASGPFSTIAGGLNNDARGYCAAVGGGSNNHSDTSFSYVGGGLSNGAAGRYSAVIGGQTNEVFGDYSAIVGGYHSYASGDGSIICGGSDNHAFGLNAVVLGGQNDTASGSNSVVLGGVENHAVGSTCIVGGYHARSDYDGCFVFSDGFAEEPFGSERHDQFRVRAAGGADFTNDSSWYFTIYDDEVDLVTTSTGAHLTVGGTWANSSNRDLKENFREVDANLLLARLDSLPITEWNYRAESPDTRHLGPVAQDFYRLFGLGADDGSITTVDPVGVALAAIQELHRRNQSLERQVAELRALIEESQSTASGPGRE